MLLQKAVGPFVCDGGGKTFFRMGVWGMNSEWELFWLKDCMVYQRGCGTGQVAEYVW